MKLTALSAYANFGCLIFIASGSLVEDKNKVEDDGNKSGAIIRKPFNTTVSSTSSVDKKNKRKNGRTSECPYPKCNLKIKIRNKRENSKNNPNLFLTRLSAKMFETKEERASEIEKENLRISELQNQEEITYKLPNMKVRLSQLVELEVGRSELQNKMKQKRYNSLEKISETDILDQKEFELLEHELRLSKNHDVALQRKLSPGILEQRLPILRITEGGETEQSEISAQPTSSRESDYARIKGLVIEKLESRLKELMDKEKEISNKLSKLKEEKSKSRTNQKRQDDTKCLARLTSVQNIIYSVEHELSILNEENLKRDRRRQFLINDFRVHQFWKLLISLTSRLPDKETRKLIERRPKKLKAVERNVNFKVNAICCQLRSIFALPVDSEETLSPGEEPTIALITYKTRQTKELAIQIGKCWLENKSVYLALFLGPTIRGKTYYLVGIYHATGGCYEIVDYFVENQYGRIMFQHDYIF